MLCLLLQLKSRMNGHHPHSQVLIGDIVEASFTDHDGKNVLLREPSNALNKVLVTGVVIGHDPADVAPNCVVRDTD